MTEATKDFERLDPWMERCGRQFSERLYTATYVDEKHWRCSGWEKRFARTILKELGCSEADADLFLAYAESQGGKCCDCEIGMNVCGGTPAIGDDGQEIHHIFRPGVTVYSMRDLQAVCECCHGEAHTANIRH